MIEATGTLRRHITHAGLSWVRDLPIKRKGCVALRNNTDPLEAARALREFKFPAMLCHHHRSFPNQRGFFKSPQCFLIFLFISVGRIEENKIERHGRAALQPGDRRRDVASHHPGGGRNSQ